MTIELNITQLLKKLNFQDASITYGRISNDFSKLYFEEDRGSQKGEPPLVMCIPVYRAYVTTGGGAIIRIDENGWYWTKDGYAHGVPKEEQNILKEFGLKRTREVM